MAKIDLGKTSKELAYQLLSDSAGKPITEADVSYANIKAIADAADGAPNTTLELTAVDGSKVVRPGGTTPLVRQYIRHDLAAVLAGLKVDLTAVQDDISKYDENAYSLSKFNSLAGAVLTADEVSVTAAAAADGKRTITFEIVEGAHVALTGKVDMVVVDNVDHRATTDEAFKDEKLNGFDA